MIKLIKQYVKAPLIMTCLMVGGLSGCDRQVSNGTTWDMSLPWAINLFHTQNALKFSQAIGEKTDGDLTIKVHAGATLGLEGPDTLRALKEGIVDIAEAPFFQLIGVEPLLGLESLPFLVNDQQELKLLYDIMRPKIDALFAKRGLKVVYLVPWPNQNIYLKKRATDLNSILGTKIRTYDRNTTEMMEALGLTPLQLASSDVVPALASGMVDAVMTSTSTGRSQKYWEFLSHIHRTNHVWITNVMTVSLKSWQALTKEQQRLLEETAKELEPQFWQVSAADDQKQLTVLEENGIQTVIPDESLMREMRALARPMWRSFIDRVGPDAQEIIDTFLAKTGKQPL